MQVFSSNGCNSAKKRKYFEAKWLEVKSYSKTRVSSSFAKSRPSNCCNACQTFLRSDIPKEIMSNFRKNCVEKSERSRQKCLQYACERYIHNIIRGRSLVNAENIKTEGKAQDQTVHVLTIHVYRNRRGSQCIL